MNRVCLYLRRAGNIKIRRHTSVLAEEGMFDGIAMRGGMRRLGVNSQKDEWLKLLVCTREELARVS